MKGITLIEVVIAVSLLAVGIIGVLQAFPLGVHLTKSSQMTTVALQLGQAKMEEKNSLSYQEMAVGTITENYGEIPDFAAYKRTTKINCVRASDLSIQDCNYEPVGDPYPMKKIDVTVWWRSSFGLGEKSINLISLMTQR